MNTFRFSLAVLTASAFALSPTQAQEATATTDPVGFVTVGISAGTGTAKRNTLFSVPLLEAESIQGQSAGTITGITASSISNSNAGWAPGALSQPESPYLIQITSGAAEGRMFLIASSAATGGALPGTANSATTVSISSADTAQVDLTTLGIVAGTDTYKIYACDTLSSFFGTPATTGVLGGANVATADSVVAVVNGTASSFFYSTTNNRWSRAVLGTPDASNVALVPYSGVQYSRLPSTPLSFVVTGAVPTVPRQMAVKNSGTTLISQFWPTDSTLSTSNLHTVVNSGASAAVADTVVLTSGGNVTTYFFDGTNWRRVVLGSPIADTTPIPVGTTVQIVRKGDAGGFTLLSQPVPYNLN